MHLFFVSSPHRFMVITGLWKDRRSFTSMNLFCSDETTRLKYGENMSDKKCVIIIDETLPLGVIANTSAVIAASLGQLCSEMIGEDLIDYQGDIHKGITTMALPILKGSSEMLKTMRIQLREFESELLVVDLISATRTTRSYEEYAAVLAQGPDGAIQYQGLGLIGDKKLVMKLTGNMGLLR